MKRVLLAVFSLAICAQSANAIPIITTVDPTKANGTFIPGSGIPARFLVNSANGAQVARSASYVPLATTRPSSM